MNRLLKLILKNIELLKDINDTCDKYKKSLAPYDDIRAKCYCVFQEYIDCTLFAFNQMLEHNTNRSWIVKFSKQLYVSIMSSAEFFIKEIIGFYPNSTLFIKYYGNRKVYLKDIIRTSFELGIIDEISKENWSNLMYIRNLLVHNNAFCYSTERMQILDVEISMTKGEPLRMLPNDFLKLVGVVIDEFHLWNLSMLKNYG